MKNSILRTVPSSLTHVVIAVVLAMNTYAAEEKMLYDFRTATKIAAWQVVNDDVMGGVSTSDFALAGEGAVFEGKVSLENNGGFASVRSLPARHDLVGCKAFVIRVRGDGRPYKFTARTQRSYDGVNYQAVFATRKGEWEEHRLQATQFVASFRGRTLSSEPPLDLAKVTSVGFLIADERSGPFKLEVAWIKAVPAVGK